MNQVTRPPRRATLGAVELVELGRSNSPFIGNRRPYLAERYRARMGQLDFLADIGSFLANFLGGTFNLLGDLIDLPLGLLSQGVDVLFTNVASLLSNIPIIGELAAQILLIGNAIIKFALSIPGELLHGLGDIMTGLGKALDTKFSESDQKDMSDSAKDKIVDRAPSAIKGVVKDLLGGASTTAPDGTPIRPRPPGEVPPVSEEGQVPSAGGLEDILEVGVPIAAGAAILFLIASR